MTKRPLIKLLILNIFFCIYVSGRAQQIAFHKHYSKGNNSTITAFTELQSLELLVGYTVIRIDTSHLGPHTLELHLMKLDKNGDEIWDKMIRKDTSRFAEDRFTIQDIEEGNDGSIVLDITYPYGEIYIVKLNRDGVYLWESYLHNSFGDYNIYNQFIKEKGRHLMLPDGGILSVGASFTSILPKATLTEMNAGNPDPMDHFFYTGYFNDAYYLNNEHIYTVGVELNGTIETLMLSDIKLNGGTNYHVRNNHKTGEKILNASLLYFPNKIRIDESVSYKDSSFYVNVYDFDLNGKMLSKTTYQHPCAVVLTHLNGNEIDWILGNQCNIYLNQTIEKLDFSGQDNFSFTDTFDNVLVLKKLIDGTYLFSFTKGSGINLWKLNRQGSLKGGAVLEAVFAPNPAKNLIYLIGNKDLYNHALSIRFTDMTGRVCGNYKFDKTESVVIDLGGLREGVYCYSILTDAGLEFKGKIVKAYRN